MQTFGLTPSKEVGEIKDAVREAILDGLIKNNYEEAFSFMLQYANEQNIKPM
jgi:poly(A) polymerase